MLSEHEDSILGSRKAEWRSTARGVYINGTGKTPRYTPTSSRLVELATEYDPARRLITKKNFVKGKFNSRTRNTERIIGSRGVEPFAVVHRIRKSRCSV